jgi:hypothetical protein
MSKSVTVIDGQVWAQRSVTWNGNVASGNVEDGDVGRDDVPRGGHGGTAHDGRHAEKDEEACAGEGPDDAPMPGEWDTIQEGRNFTRRVKTT